MTANAMMTVSTRIATSRNPITVLFMFHLLDIAQVYFTYPDPR